MQYWDQSRFDADLREALRTMTSDNWPRFLNKKAYYATRKAIWYTKKVEKETISRELEEGKAMELVRIKSGKRYSTAKKNVKSFFGSKAGRVPLLALILQHRVSHGGKDRSPWYGKKRPEGGAAMLAKMRRVFGARISSIGFIKAGWTGARDMLKASVYGNTKSMPPDDAKKKPSGRTMGYAIPATSANLNVVIFNEAMSRFDKNDALQRVGGKGLQMALDDEARDMEQMLGKEMQPAVDQFNRKQH